MLPRPPGLFVTGTDTEVGKTYVAALLARALHDAGLRVGVYKPAASGCRASTDGSLVSDDAVALAAAAGRTEELARVCPQCFAAPLAPHLAAREEGKALSTELLRAGLDYWRSSSDVVIVEGAGGLLSPIADEEYVADLAADFGYPLLVVADNRIGVIGRTLAALVVAATFRDGLDVAGVLLNEPTAGGSDPSTASNLAELRSRAVPPVLGAIKHDGHLPADVDWHSVAGIAK